jgi:hypothetical protein
MVRGQQSKILVETFAPEHVIAFLEYVALTVIYAIIEREIDTKVFIYYRDVRW